MEENTVLIAFFDFKSPCRTTQRFDAIFSRVNTKHQLFPQQNQIYNHNRLQDQLIANVTCQKIFI
jgi:hypothetical protein